MKLTAVQIRYLMVIHQLSNKGVVRSFEIANSLDVTKPSVHRMVDQLSKINLIEKEKYSFISLTENGRDIVNKYYNEFSYINSFLKEHLNLSSDAAEEGTLAILSRLEITMHKELYIKTNEC